MTLECQATPEDVMRAVEALREFGRVRSVPDKPLFGLTLELEECASNIVNHAFRRDPRQKFQVAFERLGNSVTVELRDRAAEFDPTHAPAEANPGPGERPPGHWGIPLVRRFIDEIHYRREADENVLRLTKRWDEVTT